MNQASGTAPAEPRPPGRPRRAARFCQRWAVVLLLGGGVFVCSYVVRDTIFPLYSGNKDEPVYVLQARTLAEGHLSLPQYGADTKFFQPWFTGPLGGHLIFVFPPGWPAALAAAELLFGSFQVALALVTTATVIAMYVFARVVTRDQRTAVVAAALIAASPILIVQSGLFLSYTYTLALALFFGAALLHGVRTSRPTLLALAGVLLGLVFATRPFDAGLWALPFTLYLAWVLRSEPRRLIRVLTWTAAGFVPLGAAMLAFNAHVTGDMFQFPITAVDPLNQFGFGARQLMPTSPLQHFTISSALHASGQNLRSLPAWTVGWFGGLALAVAGAVLRRRDATTWLLVGVTATFGVGYLLYWGITLMAQGASGIGPQYYIPFFAPICILGAVTLVQLWGRHRVAAAALGVVLVVVTVPFTVNKLHDNQTFNEALYRAYDVALRRRPLHHSLVFVPPSQDPYLLTNLSFAMNDARLTGSSVYATDLGAQDIELITRKADRTPYRFFRQLEPGDQILHPSVRLQRVGVASGPSVRVSEHVTNPGTHPVVVASFDPGTGIQTRVLDTHSASGHSDITSWIITPAALRTGVGTFTIGIGFGTEAALGPTADLWEQRFAYRVRLDPSGGPHLDVLIPGDGFRRFIAPHTTVWVPSDTRHVLDVTVAVTAPAGH
jgi:hypothetical protein